MIAMPNMPEHRTAATGTAPGRPRGSRLPALALAVAAATAPASLSAQDIFAGRGVYEQHCASCHGLDGRATVPGAPNFHDGTGLYASDADIINVVKYGKNLMPGYDHVLKKSEILNAVSYIRTLRR